MKKEKNEETSDFEQIRCPNCSSKLIYYKIRSDGWQCRTCGIIFKKEDIKEDN